MRSGAGLEGVARQVNLADSSKRIREGPFTRTRSGASANDGFVFTLSSVNQIFGYFWPYFCAFDTL